LRSAVGSAPARGCAPGAAGTPSPPAGRPAATRGSSRSWAVIPKRMTAPAPGRTAGHALPPAVLPGAGAVIRLGITAHDRELPRVAAGRPAGGDGVPAAPGAHPRAGAEPTADR